MPNFQRDITGEVFGYFTVMSYSHNETGLGSFWNCRCACGEERVIARNQLKYRNTCGCNRQAVSVANRLPDDLALWTRAVQGYKGNAKKRGYVWELTQDEAITLLKQDCHYCGTPPSNITRAARKNDRFILSGGIDRRDNTIGYTKENSAPCCAICNRAKKDLTMQQFLDWIKRLTATSEDVPGG